jgi:uncharacterized membrane protein
MERFQARNVGVFVILAILALILAIIGLSRASRLEVQLRKLRQDIQYLRDELQAKSPGRTDTSSQPLPIVTEKPTEEASRTATASEDVSVAQSSETASDALQSANTAEPGQSWQTTRANFEQRLAAQWFVWLGGAAIALGGLLFVKYAHDQGLIPPILRVIIGLSVAAALVVASEWLRKKQDLHASSFVPAAISAAGIVIAFGVTYAAYALYDILSPTICFPLLISVGIGAIVLARRQGPLIAALGLLGAFVTPMLVPSDNPSAIGFFLYLTVLTLFCLYELRERSWWWLGYGAIAGATVWSLLWAHGSYGSDVMGLLPPGLFALAMGAGSLFLPRGRAVLSDDLGSLADVGKAHPPLLIAVAGVGAAVLILAAFVIAHDHKEASLVLFLVGVAAVTAISWFKTSTSYAALAAAIVSWLVFMAWPEVGFYEPAFDERGFWVTVPGLVQPPRFVTWTLIAGALHLGAGVIGLLRFKTLQWAALMSFAAIAFVFGAWAKADFALSDMNWALIAFAALTVLAMMLRRVRDTAQTEAFSSTDALLIGVALLALFIADRLLHGISQTLAVAAIAAASAYGSRLLPAISMGAVASIIATFAAARLFITRDLYLDETTLALGHHWPIYGYGVPAALFWLSSKWLNRDIWPKWSMALEGLSLGLLVTLASVELRTLISGKPSGDFTLLELGAQACAWLGAAFGLAYRQKFYSGFISRWAATALIAGATAVLVLGLLVNPAFLGDVIEGNLLLNSLTLAYLLPVPLLALIAPRVADLKFPWARSPLGILALVLLLAYVTLQIMRIYQGSRLGDGFASDAERATQSPPHGYF